VNEGPPTEPTITYLYAYGDERTGHLRADTVKEIRSKLAPYRFGLAAREIAKELHIRKNQKVLEIGSGLGMLGEAIQKEAGSGVSYYGVELALNSAIASNKRGVEPIQADATMLPFGSESFDSLVTTDVLEHVSRRRAGRRGNVSGTQAGREGICCYC
jgi:2-polyprenyl-3-methyl-5-hydroxy-6-metoxy-1,4-benzoquinol methylase